MMLNWPGDLHVLASWNAHPPDHLCPERLTRLLTLSLLSRPRRELVWPLKQ
jgi:hypothetical protein